MIELRCRIATRVQVLTCTEPELNVLLQRLERICDSDSVIYRHDDKKPTGHYVRTVGGIWKFIPQEKPTTYTLYAFSYETNTLKKVDVPDVVNTRTLNNAVNSLIDVPVMRTPVARNVTIYKWFDKQGRLRAWVNKNVLD